MGGRGSAGGSGARGGGAAGGGSRQSDQFPQNGSYVEQKTWAQEHTKNADEYSLQEFRQMTGSRSTENEFKTDAVLSKAAAGSTLQEGDGTTWRKLSSGDWKVTGRGGETREPGQLATILIRSSSPVRRIKFR